MTYTEMKKKTAFFITTTMASVMLVSPVMPSLSIAAQSPQELILQEESTHDDFVTAWEEENLIPFSIFQNGEFRITEEGVYQLSSTEYDRLQAILNSANFNIQLTMEYLAENPITRMGRSVITYQVEETESGLIVRGIDGVNSRGPITTSIFIGATAVRFMMTGSFMSLAAATFSIAGWQLKNVKHIGPPLSAVGAVLGTMGTLGLDIEITPPIEMIRNTAVRNLHRHAVRRQWLRSVMPW